MAPSGKREINRAERVRSLTQAGLSLFLARGVRPVTIREITETAGTAKGNFYRYFPDKEALVREILRPVREQLMEAFRESELQIESAKTEPQITLAYMTLGAAIARVLLEQPDTARFYLQEHRSAATSASPIRELADEIQRAAITHSGLAVRRGVVTTHNPHVGAIAVMGAAEGLALSFLRNELEVSPQEAVQGLVQIILFGISKPR